MSPTSILFDPRRVHLLIDPDHWIPDDLDMVLKARPLCVGSIIVGGTYVHEAKVAEISQICRRTGLPVGNLLSIGQPEVLLVPGVDFAVIPILLGAHSTAFLCDHIIRAVPFLERNNVKTVTIAYLPIDGGVPTSAQFFTQHHPIPRHKPEIVRTLAAAAKYLGLDGIYLDAGSGATLPASAEEVRAAKEASQLPVLVGGGIQDSETISVLMASGASSVIIGSVVERRRSLSWLHLPIEVPA